MCFPTINSVCVIVHYDGAINEKSIEGSMFSSPRPKIMALKKCISLQWMKKPILRKLHRDPQEKVATIHFYYPIRLSSGLNHHTAIEINDDDDVQSFFGICESVEL